jgi:Na+/proline symporter
VLAQSRRSFAWALTGAVAALAFFIAAAGYTLWTGEARAAVIPVVSGAVVEVVAGIVFFLYGKTTSQMGDFYGRLERLQRYLLANSICESLQGCRRGSGWNLKVT